MTDLSFLRHGVHVLLSSVGRDRQALLEDSELLLYDLQLRYGRQELIPDRGLDVRVLESSRLLMMPGGYRRIDSALDKQLHVALQYVGPGHLSRKP